MKNSLFAIAAGPRRPHATPSERRRWVQAWERSDSTQQAFAQAHDLNLGTLRSWIRQHGTPAVAPSEKPAIEFREISLDQVLGTETGGGRPAWEVEVRLPSGVVIAYPSREPHLMDGRDGWQTAGRERSF